MDGNSSSRGTTIITQKENKGEYNGSWAWSNSYNVYAQAFDQNDKNSGIPYRYPAAKASPNDDSWSASLPSNAVCASDFSTTSGDRNTRTLEIEPLYSGTKIENQKSCNPHVYNAGNWYNFAAATAGSNNASVASGVEVPNSICPKGWQLPENSGIKSYQRLIRDIYQIADGSTGSVDANFLNNSAISIARLGFYSFVDGNLGGRGHSGGYWSSTTHSSTHSYGLSFYAHYLYSQNTEDTEYGHSIRCVSR